MIVYMCVYVYVSACTFMYVCVCTALFVVLPASPAPAVPNTEAITAEEARAVLRLLLVLASAVSTSC